MRARTVSPAGRLLAHLGRATVSIMVALLIAELGLRLAGVKFNGSFYTNDSATGWFLRPNAEGWSTDERSIYVHINSAGMNDREHAVAKPPDTFRIAVLGDSMTASIQVAARDTSSAVLERSMASCGALPGRKVEVLNFGVPGYNTAQMLLTLRSRVWQYSPDAVVFEFLSGNGMLNNRRDLTNADAALAPYFVLHDGKLELDDSYRRLPAEQAAAIRSHNQTADLMNRVRFLQLAARAVRNLPGLLARGKGLDARARKYGADYQLRLVYTPPAYPEIEDAWRVTEAIVSAMHDEVRAHGARFWIAVDNTPEQAQRAEAAKAGLLGRWGPDALLYPDWRIVSLARREGLPVVALSPYLWDYGERHHVFLSGWTEGRLGVGHWNELGQRVVGEYLAQRLCEFLLKP